LEIDEKFGVVRVVEKLTKEKCDEIIEDHRLK
jgi:hypothetical protein